MDQAITQWINSLAGSNILSDSVMIMATNVGVPLLVALVVAQWWSGIDRTHVRHTCIAAGLSFLIGLGLNQIILLFVHRVRPYDAGVSHLIISKSPDWSFPSDHATGSIAIVATFAIHGLPRRTLLFGLLALLICWSRIFVGTHYLTDVLGGSLTGVIAATLVERHTRYVMLAKVAGSRIDNDAGCDLRTGACGHGRTESAILARSDRPLRPSGGTRFQCYRSADGDTDDGAQCVPLSWRTEIELLTFDVLDMALASNRTPSAWSYLVSFGSFASFPRCRL